jgi:polyisoprenoid-binding protein YceI
MKKLLTIALLALTTSAFSQQYLTREATLSFDAGSPLEDIYAVSESASAVYDAATGKLGVQVLMTSFQFKRALMQEHFNENYAESEKFPKAQFTGVFQGGEAIGQLTIHGQTKDIAVPCEILEADGSLILNAEFPVNIEEFGIAIPGAVADKIAKDAKVQVKATLKKRA